MELKIREKLFVLDYEGEKKQVIFDSGDKNNLGFAMEIVLEESQSGHSDLGFKMPSVIIEENQIIKNELIEEVVPLAVVRYERTGIYNGPETTKNILLPNGEEIEKTYTPGDIVEFETKDFVIQPFEKTRDGETTLHVYQAIDKARHELSKKKMGLTIDDDTITGPEESLWQGLPFDIPGKIKYIPWTSELWTEVGETSDKTTWDPNALAYPLKDEHIEQLLQKKDIWDYGVLGTVFYWPIEKDGRYQGVRYRENGFLTMTVYNTKIEGFDPTEIEGESNLLLPNVAVDWSFTPPRDTFLSPNNAENYLKYVLKGTSWSVGTVDIEKEEIYLPDGSSEGQKSLTDKVKTISIKDSNVYNGVVELAREFQLYPVFDTINNTVSLVATPGKQNGLKMSLGDNLERVNIKLDGDRVITKLRVRGGADSQGSERISLAEAERQPDAITPLPVDVGGQTRFEFINYQIEIDEKLPIVCPTNYIEIESEVDARLGWYKVGDKYLYKTAASTHEIMHNEQIWLSLSGSWYPLYDYEGNVVLASNFFEEMPTRVLIFQNNSFKEDPEFDPNHNAYSICRSPVGTDFILNFKYLFNKGFMNRESIEDLYIRYSKIAKERRRRISLFATDFIRTRNALDDAYNLSDLHNTTYLGKLNTLMNVYYVDPSKPISEGTFRAFSDAPEDAFYVSGQGYFINVDGHDIKIPVFPDGHDNAGANRYTPREKGLVLHLVELLGQDQYKDKIKITEEMTPAYITGISSGVATWNPSGATETVNEYGRDLSRYYSKYVQASHKIQEAIQNIEEINYQQDITIQWIASEEEEIQNLYSSFLIEGAYEDDHQVFPSLLLKEGLKASEMYGHPDISYEISAIDASGLIEFRDIDAMKVHDFSEKIHTAGHLIAKPGDTVYTYDLGMGLSGAPATVKTIMRSLDNPQLSKIELDTKFEDVENAMNNIITATNTVLNNQDIYARTAILNKDGTIQSDSLQRSLDNPQGGFSIVGGLGKSLFDTSGFSVEDPDDPNFKLSFKGAGLYSTSDAGESWEPIITQNGINANRIAAGTIDTNRVSVMDGRFKKVILDNHGLVVKENANQPYRIGEPWENVKTFIGVDDNGNGKAYIDGVIKAVEGNIGPWQINDTSISKGSTSHGALGAGNMYFGNDGISISDKFKVDHEGNLTASDVSVQSGTFQGDIYLPLGGQVIGGDGLITNLQFTSGAEILPLGKGMAWGQGGEGDWYDEELKIEAYIPDNFTVESAEIVLTHIPIVGTWAEVSFYGRGRKIVAYKYDNLNSFFVVAFGLTKDLDYEGNPSRTIIDSAFGADGWTSQTGTISNPVSETVKSGDISSWLSPGRNRISLGTLSSYPDYTGVGDLEDENNAIREGLKLNCFAVAQLNIIGFYQLQE